MKTALALRHVHFEDLGIFQRVLAKSGYRVSYFDVGVQDIETIDPLEPDLLFLLGAPFGVYERDTFPFVLQERSLLRRRMMFRLPTVGICLGAQQIAAARGAKVTPGGFKEIGFAPVSLSDAGRNSALRHLDGIPLLHWHGDVFELPEGATGLASTDLCPNQAFCIGPNVLGLQFHPEIAPAMIERWLIGHASELTTAGIDIRKIRMDAASYESSMVECCARMFEEWLANIVTNDHETDLSKHSRR